MRRLHPLQPTSAAHVIPASQLAAQNRSCSTVVMEALNMRGSQGQWGVGGCNALVEGEFILPCLCLHCPTYTNNERNSKEPNKVKCWIDGISERYPELGRPCKLIAGTCRLRGKQGKACKSNRLASQGRKSCKLSSIYGKFVVDKFISLLIPAFPTYPQSPTANPLLHLP